MSWDGVLVRFGEIGIKSPPVRRQMEERLRSNLEDGLLRRRIEGHVRRLGPRMWMTGGDHAALVDVGTHAFGVVSVSPTRVTESDLPSISAAACKLALERDWTRFAVRASRTGEHPYTSQDVAVDVGSDIYKAAEAAGRSPKVDLTDPELELHIEVRDDKAYLFTDKLPGPGGLPMGSQGKVVALLSDEASCVAAWLMMRRGCSVIPIHAGDSGSAPVDMFTVLGDWGMPPEYELLPVCSGTTSKQALLDAAAAIGKQRKADAIITGDTLESAMLTTDLPVLRPVCGLISSEMARISRQVGLQDDAPESLLDDEAAETVESLLAMQRTVAY